MKQIWRKHFSAEKFSMKHDNPTVFIISQWQRDAGPNLYYLMYRWMVAAVFLVSWVLSIVDVRDIDKPATSRAKWLIYLTNWGFTMCTVQALCCAAMLSSWFRTTRNRDTGSTAEEDNKALKLYKIYWASNIIATDLAFGITIIYWSLIHDEETMPLDTMNIIVHAVNSVIMLMDMCVVAYPVRLFHCFWPLAFGLCYIFFSIIYYLAGGTGRDGQVYIYNILNWEKPGSTVLTLLGVCAFLVMLHCLSYGLYHLKKSLHNHMQSVRDDAKMYGEKQAYDNKGMATDIV